jgi:hypothetical protein
VPAPFGSKQARGESQASATGRATFAAGGGEALGNVMTFCTSSSSMLIFSTRECLLFITPKSNAPGGGGGELRGGFYS